MKSDQSPRGGASISGRLDSADGNDLEIVNSLPALGAHEKVSLDADAF